MKMAHGHFEFLKRDCTEALAHRGLSLNDITSTREAWDTFHAANGYWLYNQGYNDAHIETALRRIFDLR